MRPGHGAGTMPPACRAEGPLSKLVTMHEVIEASLAIPVGVMHSRGTIRPATGEALPAMRSVSNDAARAVSMRAITG